MARNRMVMKTFCRSALILKMVTRRVCPKAWKRFLTKAEAVAMIVTCNILERGTPEDNEKRPRRKPLFPLVTFGVRMLPLRTLNDKPKNQFSFAGRGFILFFLGFFGPGISSVVPPWAAILAAADLEKPCALTTRRLLNSPMPRMRTPSAGPLASPAFFKAA